MTTLLQRFGPLVKELFDKPLAGRRFAEKPQGLDIGNSSFRIQTEKALEREAITQLVLGLIVGEIVQRLHHQHFEHHRHVVRFASGTPLALFLVNQLEQRPESVPINDAIKPWQWITQFFQLGEAVFLIENARLGAIHPTLCEYDYHAEDRVVLEVPC